MIAIGLGCRKGARGPDLAALVREALVRGGLDPVGAVLAAPAVKSSEAGLYEAAERLGLPLVFIAPEALEAAAPAAQTRSPRVLALTGLPSLAECAALAAAGKGSRLIVPRTTSPTGACAIAAGTTARGEAP